MSPSSNAFSSLAGKTRDLLRSRPLEFFFFFAFLAAAAAAVSAYRNNASPVSLELEGKDGTLALAEVYSLSADGVLEDMDRRGKAWVSAEGRYCWRLLIALPKGGLADLTRVRVGIGPRSFEFGAADFSEFGLLRLGAVEKREWDIYNVPGRARDARSLYPSFEPINWRGDVSFLAGALRRFAVYCAGLLLLFAPLAPSLFSGRPRAEGAAGRPAAPPPPSAGGTGWHERVLRPGRPFHLGLVFLLTFGVVGAVSLLRVDPHHDGVMLKPACDVAAGQTLFRDTFTQYGALTTWAQALAVRTAGKHLLALRLQTALTYGLIAVLMWLAYSRFLPAYLATFSCLSWLFLGYFFLNYPGMSILPWATLFAVCAALLTLWLLLRFLEGGGRRALFAAGFACALTFWFKINYGAVSFLASCLFLALLQPREGRGRAAGTFGAFLGGCCSAHVLFFGWLAAHGSLRDFWVQSVRFALAFSGNTIFFTNETAAVRVLKSLLQVDSPHGGISYLWLALPLASCAVFISSAYSVAVKKDAGKTAPALLAVSCAALGLWLGYYPVPALFHMHLSSVLFFGLLAHLVLRAAGKLGFSGNRLLVLALLVMLYLPDLGFRLRSFMSKMADASNFERIETPAFLRGMYVPRSEKRAFAKLEELIGGTSGPLVNLTNSGLFSLYREDGPNLHKMYMDWGWINSFLYPDYIPAVARQLMTGEGCVLTGDYYMVPGYVPARVFPAFVDGEISNNPVALLLPGARARLLSFAGVEAVRRPGAPDGFPFGWRFRLKAGSAPAPIDSVTVKIISRYSVQTAIPRYEFEYELLPKIFDPAARELVRKRYLFDPGRNAYAVAGPLDGKAGAELLDALSGVFLYEKNSFIADTFVGSKKPTVSISRNGKVLKFGDFFDGKGYRAGDRIDLVVPAAQLPGTYAARIRINFKGRKYQEEKIVVYAR